MKVLVVNAGSTSLKAEVVDALSKKRLGSVHVQRIGEKVADHGAAMRHALSELLTDVKIEAVGHRVVHGGQMFRSPTPIKGDVVKQIQTLVPLAPMHLPANLSGIAACMAALPNVPHVAVFDTAVHTTMPRRASTYAIPQELAAKHDIRRYGFHGQSHHWVARQAAQWLGEDLRDLKLITAHLGGGCSVTAWENGASVDTSMGLTPLEGLVMGTRSGDLDPGVLLHLARQEDFSVAQLDELLNKRCGLSGLSGVGSDLRDIEEKAAQGDDACRLAVAVFGYRVRKYIGAYAAVLGGVNAIIFTGGIGENAVAMRQRIATRLDFLGASFDMDCNMACRLSEEEPVVEISGPHSRTKLLVVKTDENMSIAEDTVRIVRKMHRLPERKPIPVKISARHVHLTEEHIAALFGPGHTLTPRKPLGQPGQFICEERVALIGPKRTIEHVGIIGPPRNASQVEISRTDEFTLGVDAPVRGSGDHRGSIGITIEGPAGRVALQKGVICAWRHIHMTPEDAEVYGVSDRDMVEVAINSGERELVYRDVLVRVKDSFALEMHIDTDEANAANLGRDATGMLQLTLAKATLTKKRVDGRELL